MQKIIKEGSWEYTENHFEKVIAVEQDWDHFYEEGYSEGEPYLNSEGLVYYLHFGEYWFNELGHISSRGGTVPFLSLDDAMVYAENELPKLKWNN